VKSSLSVNLLLAFMWAAVNHSFGLADFVIGFIIGYLALAWLSPLVGAQRYVRWLPKLIGFSLFYIWELIVANVRVAYDVVTPAAMRDPAVVAVPLDARTDFEIMLLANLITLTPGTLSLDLSPDRQTLYVHAMFVEDPEEFRREIKDGFERRVLDLLR
jgi:multicomponent Na+:H+ antiporter subunit E